MTMNLTDERQAWHGQVQLWDLKRIAALRERHGWTQEELAERSGLSVRTIRNLELGRIRNPRRSSIDLLTTALGIVAERDDAGPLERPRWRGPQPPTTALVGSRAEQDRLARTVRTNRLTTLVGPGGVGKTRLALNVAADVGHFFRHGVVVVELGDLAPERPAGHARTLTVLERVRRELGDLDQADRDRHVLVVLDNAEHVPDGVTAAARELLSAHPDLQILITARRRVTERLGVNHAIAPLPADGPHAPAVELVLRHVGADTRMAADHAREVRLVTELCRRLGGLPRYLEFAAERMRTLPVKLLLEHGPTMGMLWSDDRALLPHQRSVADSIQWDLDMFSADHRHLLTRIAAWPNRRFTLDAVAAAHGRGGPSGRSGPSSGTNPLAVLSDLLEMSFIVPDPGHRDGYRLAPYIAEAVDDVAVPAPRLAQTGGD